jgi:hypothetical protein
VRALRRLNNRAILARVWASGECGGLRAFELAVWDNLSHRELNALEIARALTALKNVFEVPHEVLIHDYLPVFGLDSHKNVLRSYLALHPLNPELRKLFLEGRITQESAERLSQSTCDFQCVMAAVLSKARWSASLQREILDMVEELSSIWKCAPGEIFGRTEIGAVLNGHDGSSSQRGEKIRETLYQWRNPRLSDARRQFQLEKVKLGLPAQVRLSPDPYFESNRVRVEFEVSSADGFRKIAVALQNASERTDLEGLFRVV